MDGLLERRLRDLVDRETVKDTLYRYASTIDNRDFDALRALFAPDAIGRYGDDEPLHGRDEVVAWIEDKSVDRAWQHHKLTVYHVDIDGDEARALTYHTSHQTRIDDPETVVVIVARYHDVLRRAGESWLITEKVMEVGWREDRRQRPA